MFAIRGKSIRYTIFVLLFPKCELRRTLRENYFEATLSCPLAQLEECQVLLRVSALAETESHLTEYAGGFRKVFVAKLEQRFTSFKSSFREKEEHDVIEVEKLKSGAETSSSFKHKASGVEYEFKSSIFDHIELCSAQRLGGIFSKVNSELEHTIVLIAKC